jgi:hypothetical protein
VFKILVSESIVTLNQNQAREHPIFANGAVIARAISKNGENTLILQALCACKISDTLGLLGK